MSNKGKKPIFVSQTISFQRKNNFLIVNKTNHDIKLPKNGGWEKTDKLKVKFTVPLTVSIQNLQRCKASEHGLMPSVSKVIISMNQLNKIKDKKKKQIKSSWGTLRTLLYNTICGLYKTHTIKFRFVGVGYKANLKKNVLILRLGFSHRHFFKVPSKIFLTKIKKRPPTFLIKGLDLDLIKNTAFILRSFKKPEPYKGKGVVLLNEHIKLKEGKKTKTS